MKKHTKKSPSQKNLIALGTIWLLSPLILLTLLTYVFTLPLVKLFDAESYTNSLDKNFWISATIVVTAHIIAFSLIPIIITVKKLAKSTIQVATIISIGVAVVAIQWIARLASDSISRIDCADMCTSATVPAYPGSVLNTLTVSALVLMLFIFSVVLISRLVQSDSNR